MLNQKTIAYRKAKKTDLEAVRQFLSNFELPIAGINEQFENFFLLVDSSLLIGCAGLEFYGIYGLIRSVAIETSYQGKKFGNLLVNILETYAKEKNISELYLLTETAEYFFTKLGYEQVERILVPPEIQGCLEYSSACKDSALVMKKILI